VFQVRAVSEGTATGTFIPNVNGISNEPGALIVDLSPEEVQVTVLVNVARVDDLSEKVSRAVDAQMHVVFK